MPISLTLIAIVVNVSSKLRQNITCFFINCIIEAFWYKTEAFLYPFHIVNYVASQDGDHSFLWLPGDF